MTSERKAISNAKNAARSTGPRSKGGKARSSQNATRHGLAKRFGRDAEDIRNIERLARAVIAAGANCSKDTARALATVQLELIHIRKVRADACDSSVDQIASDGSLLSMLAKTEGFDRYERRAMSRFRRVLRCVHP